MLLGQLEVCRGDELKLQNLGLYSIFFFLLFTQYFNSSRTSRNTWLLHLSCKLIYLKYSFEFGPLVHYLQVSNIVLNFLFLSP